MPRQVKQIANCLQRIIDLMGDGGRQASRGGQLLIPAKGILGALLCGYVSNDGRISDDLSSTATHRGNRNEHVHACASTPHALGLKGGNAVTPIEPVKIDADFMHALARR